MKLQFDIQLARVRWLYGFSSYPFWLDLLLSLLYLVVGLSHFDNFILWNWFLAISAANFLKLAVNNAIYSKLKRDPTALSLEQVEHFFAFTAVTTALLWSAHISYHLDLSKGGISIIQLAILGGLGAVSVMVNSVSRSTTLMVTIALMAPLILRLGLESSQEAYVMAGTLAIFSISIVGVSNRLRQMMEKQFSLQSEREEIIADLQESNEELRVAQGKAEKAARMAAFGEMTAGLAHEINNPLAIIVGKKGLIERRLSEQLKQDSKLSKDLNHIEDMVVRIQKIIVGLKKFLHGTRRKSTVESVEIRAAVDEIIEIYQHRFQSNNITLKSHLEEAQVSINVIHVEQVLVNIFNNAIDAQRGQPSPALEIWAEIDQTFYHLHIKDAGPGVPEDIRQFIFDPFFSTKAKQGTGIGLSLSKGLIEAMDGHLVLADECSSEFIISLRLIPPAVATAA